MFSKAVLILGIFNVAAFAQKEILILQKNANSVGYYDAKGKPLASVPVGVKPHEFERSADGKLLYVTNYGVGSYTDRVPGGNTISIIDIAKRKAVGEIHLGEYRRPHGIARGKSGRLYVTCDFPASLLVIDPVRKSIVKRYALDQKLPHMVAVTADETKAFTANAGSGTITAITLGSKPQQKNIQVGGVPMGLALDPPEKLLFATTQSGDTVALIDPAENVVKETINIPGGPCRLQFTPDGKQVIFTLIGAGGVSIVDTASRKEVHRFEVGKAAEGVLVDPFQNVLYVTAQGDDKAFKYSLKNWKPLLEFKTEAAPDPVLLVR